MKEIDDLCAKQNSQLKNSNNHQPKTINQNSINITYTSKAY